MMTSFEKAFDGMETDLSKRMDVSDDLLRMLKDKKIIEASHAEQIQREYYNPVRVDALIKILKRRPDTDIPAFCDILSSTNQMHVIKILWPEGCAPQPPSCATRHPSSETNGTGDTQLNPSQVSGPPRGEEEHTSDSQVN